MDDKISFDNCLKCNYCTTVCPVMRVYPSYPGPKRLGPEIERFRVTGMDCNNKWLDYCLGCEQCNTICPNGVKIANMIAQAKTRIKKHGQRKLRDYFLARPALAGKVAGTTAPLANEILKLRVVARAMGLTPQRPFPHYIRKPLTVRPNRSLQRVVFFPGCFINYNEPGIGKAVVNVLEHNGFGVEIAGCGCCGLPALANGDNRELLASARNNLNILKDAVEANYKIITACSSCGSILKSHYAELFSDHQPYRELAEKVAAHTFDLGEFLQELADNGQLNCEFGESPVKLAHHSPCHLKSQGIGKPWVDILSLIPGVKIAEIDRGCCGMAGTYGFKQEKYEISMLIGQDLFTALKGNNPDAVITECGTCQMQIQHGTHIKTMHPVEIMSRAYASKS
ncbi:MAG: anaerobic glycerol-3-phosphate dehydrogenase subunit C [Syntrophomonadaceae bacterium]|jgi:glycerol-3-phosphate dehydrogenase subunit C